MQMSVSAKKDFFYSSLTSQAKEVKKYSVVVSSVATQKLKTFLCAALFFLLPCWAADTSTALSIVTGCPPFESNEKKKQKTYSLHVDMRHADVQLTKPQKEKNNNKQTENS